MDLRHDLRLRGESLVVLPEAGRSNHGAIPALSAHLGSAMGAVTIHKKGDIRAASLTSFISRTSATACECRNRDQFRTLICIVFGRFDLKLGLLNFTHAKS